MNKRNYNKILELRHELHQYPELSLHEEDTMRRIEQFLKTNTSLQIVHEDGWMYAVKKGVNPKAPGIAFRADMDALPIDESSMDLAYTSVHAGISHKCGHDGHCAALCGLALELEGETTERDIYLIFQPAEEIGAGAKKAVKLIDEKEISEIYAFHNLSGYSEGQIIYRRGLTQPASEGLIIHFHGMSSHASEPEKGRNPASVIAKTALYSQEILDKNTYTGMTLCTIVGIESGRGDFGISPGEGKIMMTLRAEVESEMKRLEEEILLYAATEAGKAGIEMTHQISDYFPETRNTEKGIERILKAAAESGIDTLEMSKLWRGSEDFGHYLKKCDGCIFYVGNGMSWPAIHTKEYDFNDEILNNAVDIFFRLARE